jgi:hypothetical protein
MKYAFLFGTSAFIVPHGIIAFADHDTSKDILRIKSVYHDDQPGTALEIDLDIKDDDGHEIKLSRNKAVNAGLFKVQEERNNVKVFKNDGSLVIQVHQLDDEAAMGLELNIVAELERNSPIAVIRVFGEFMAESLQISAENEKLFINNDGYATLALAGDSNVRFTEAGVIL